MPLRTTDKPSWALSDTMIGSLDHFQTETLVPRLRSTYEFPILSVPKQFLVGYPVVAQDSTGRVVASGSLYHMSCLDHR